MRWLLTMVLLAPSLTAATAADLARAIRESAFDRDECYRVRDLTIVKEDLKIYLTDGRLIFSKPIAGRRIAAAFTADVDGGDAEVLLMPPNRAERQSLANYTGSPNLDEHFRSALFLFSGNDYDALKSQFPQNPANQKAPEMGPVLDERWTPVLHNLGSSFQTRLTLDLMGSPGYAPGLFAALVSGVKLGNFDVVFDPRMPEQIMAGQVATRGERLYFDTWTSFPAKSFRKNPAPRRPVIAVRDYRIQATVNPDLTLTAVTRVKVKPAEDGMTVAAFDISPEMEISDVKVDGRAADVLQRETMRLDLTRNGNHLFLVTPAEPLRSGREYEFEFDYSGKVIHEAGDRVFYVSARGGWYPTHGLQYATFDLLFRYPRDLDLVSAGEVVEDRAEGDWKITRRRTSAPIRLAGFNLGNYAHARVERSGYTVDVCANRALEKALQPRPQPVAPPPLTPPRQGRRSPDLLGEALSSTPPAPDPLARLRSMASDVASALDFMASKFGPPALPHLTVSPIPGAFGQGFPGLVYLSTLSYLRTLPRSAGGGGEVSEIFFEDMLQAHEVAHQWWGNRVSSDSYRDSWLMEALANYSALLYVEKSKGERSADLMMEHYRTALLAKNEAGQTVESAGPIVLGTRLESSQEPRAWRNITYGKGAWIIHMLRRRMGDERFFPMLRETLRRYDHQDMSTEQFRELAAEFLPPKSDDPKLEGFFDQWVYGTGIPALKLTYTVRGKAPALKLVATVTQSEVDEEFSTLTPVEIQMARGRPITRWVRAESAPVTVTIPLQQAPIKVTLDPHHSVLRR